MQKSDECAIVLCGIQSSSFRWTPSTSLLIRRLFRCSASSTYQGNHSIYQGGSCTPNRPRRLWGHDCNGYRRAQIFLIIGQHYLGDPEFEPVWEELDKM